MNFPFYLALATLILYSLVAFDLVRGSRSIRALRMVAPELPPHPPKLSIVVAARNEEQKIEAALASLLRLDYPALQIIVVDDRSEDTTGPLLDSMAHQDNRLEVLHVRELPAGWLGKNHALHLGSQQARGELILFTDADIVMQPSLLKRAVALLLADNLDHLVVSPRMCMPGTLLPMIGLTFMLIFAMFARPWKARDPKSYFHIGIGAFNLVRAASYRSAGGHGAIRMRPDDDLKLGKLLKKAGFRQDIASGPDFMVVEWYSSTRELIRGLEKNAFAGCDYRLGQIMAGVLLHAVCSVWPYLALVLTSGATRLVYVAVVLLISLLLIDCANRNQTKRWHALGFPVAMTIFLWILLRTTWLNIVQGGIFWRGTFYPLKELKKNRV